MPRHFHDEDLRIIESVVRQNPGGVTARQIGELLQATPPHRTLQHRLRALVAAGRLAKEGSGRGTRYRLPKPVYPSGHAEAGRPELISLLSETGAEMREYVRQPAYVRKPVGYDQSFLDSYQPNETFYLSEKDRKRLRETGRSGSVKRPDDAYAQKILNRFLIDLSWNSSRLEGNTYSLLETSRLLELGEEAEGKQRTETQMILNHKQAIEFLVAAEGVGFNRYTLLNLHALLADGLLRDPDAAGRLRRISVGIEGSVFHPLEMPQLIDECFDRILAIASAIRDPFERTFFAMVQLPYLQPFDDVNKRVSRLAANISLLQENLSPLSFDEVPRQLYVEALLGVYELNRTELLRDVFLWAYERSAAHYAAVRQSVGEPDSFRMRHRAALRDVVGDVVRGPMNRQQAAAHLRAWSQERIEAPERSRFCEIAEKALLGLHEGNLAPYGVRPAEFAAWQERWGT